MKMVYLQPFNIYHAFMEILQLIKYFYIFAKH